MAYSSGHFRASLYAERPLERAIKFHLLLSLISLNELEMFRYISRSESSQSVFSIVLEKLKKKRIET